MTCAQAVASLTLPQLLPGDEAVEQKTTVNGYRHTFLKRFADMDMGRCVYIRGSLIRSQERVRTLNGLRPTVMLQFPD